MFTTFTATTTRTVVGTAGMTLCAGLCLIGATAPAHAATLGATTPGDTVVRSQRVSYADLDLARPEGRATLDHRIRAAARTVCVTDSVDEAAQLAEYRCINHAVAAARVQAANVSPQSAGL